MNAKCYFHDECRGLVLENTESDYGLCQSCYEGFEIYMNSLSFSSLRETVQPIAKRGRVNKVLREWFFEKNDKGRWIRINDCDIYSTNSPSNPRWKLIVVPTLAKLLTEKYREPYEVSEWVYHFIGKD